MSELACLGFMMAQSQKTFWQPLKCYFVVPNHSGCLTLKEGKKNQICIGFFFLSKNLKNPC